MAVATRLQTFWPQRQPSLVAIDFRSKLRHGMGLPLPAVKLKDGINEKTNLKLKSRIDQHDDTLLFLPLFTPPSAAPLKSLRRSQFTPPPTAAWLVLEDKLDSDAASECTSRALRLEKHLPSLASVVDDSATTSPSCISLRGRSRSREARSPPNVPQASSTAVTVADGNEDKGVELQNENMGGQTEIL
ncbi:hypothetical protein H0H81_003697, partial [Sphagnurus paluster]